MAKIKLGTRPKNVQADHRQASTCPKARQGAIDATYKYRTRKEYAEFVAVLSAAKAREAVQTPAPPPEVVDVDGPTCGRCTAGAEPRPSSCSTRPTWFANMRTVLVDGSWNLEPRRELDARQRCSSSPTNARPRPR
jgi:hypothetical protein